jgi:hypothetical protein
VSLRDKIAHRLCALLDDDWYESKRLYQSEADAILALVRAHLTSEEAVERARRQLSFHPSVRAAIAAALGEGE